MEHTNGTTDTNPLGKATSIDFFNFSTPQMRAFHMSWIAFFLCFFAWFGISPLMAVVRDELALTEAQIGNIGIAAVATTALARPVLGSICDWIGPRRAYSGLLIIASFPVMGIGLATSYETFLICRLLIGFIGASFVITQYHSSKMFASNAVGTANAITAGWGNLGGGATQAWAIENTAGPAPRGMPVIPIEIDGGELVVDAGVVAAHRPDADYANVSPVSCHSPELPRLFGRHRRPRRMDEPEARGLQSRRVRLQVPQL